MSMNLAQVFVANPITTIGNTDLLYVVTTGTTDAAINGSSFKAQFAPLTTKGDLYTFSTVNARLAVGTVNGQMLQVNSAAATGLAWSTATYPVTTTVNQILYSSSANVVAGITVANSGRLVTSAAGVPSVSTTGGLIAENEVTGTSATVAINNGYIPNNVGLVTLTLPTTAAVGTCFSVQGSGSGGWIIAQNANQILHVGSSPSTTGVTGSVASSNRYDAVLFKCIVANLEWAASGVQGNLTVA